MLPGVRDIFCLLDCSDIWEPPIFKSFVDVERVVQAFYEFRTTPSVTRLTRQALEKLLRDSLFFNALTLAQKTEGWMELLHTAARRTHEALQSYRPHMPS
jgi:hypothetical protein